MDFIGKIIDITEEKSFYIAPRFQLYVLEQIDSVNDKEQLPTLEEYDAVVANYSKALMQNCAPSILPSLIYEAVCKQVFDTYSKLIRYELEKKWKKEPSPFYSVQHIICFLFNKYKETVDNIPSLDQEEDFWEAIKTFVIDWSGLNDLEDPGKQVEKLLGQLKLYETPEGRAKLIAHLKKFIKDKNL